MTVNENSNQTLGGILHAKIDLLDNRKTMTQSSNRASERQTKTEKRQTDKSETIQNKSDVVLKKQDIFHPFFVEMADKAQESLDKQVSEPERALEFLK